MSKHNDIYNILGKLESLQPKEQPVQATEKKSIYESVEARGSVLEGVGKVEKLLAEKYVGFKEAKPHPKELEMDADVRRMQIQQRADKAERELARRRAEPKNIGQKIAKDLGEPLKKLFKGDIRGSLSEVDVPEGNEFSGALAAAKAQGKKEFEVDGKTYQVKESGLQAYLGKKKYGEKGMQALQKAGRDGASKEKMAKIRAKHDKMDEAEFGEGNKFTGNLMKARAQGKKEADLDGDGDMEKVREGWDEMQAFLKKKEGPQPKGGSGKVAGRRYGGSAQKDDEGDEEPSADGAAKKRGRPKKDKFAEVAPPGAKAERMVKHIKKGYAKDGKITPKEKSIAYATAWKAKKSGKLDESVIYEGGDPQLDHILNRFKNEVKRFQAGDELDDDLYMALYDYYMDQGEIPYGVAKARDGDPYQWVEDRLASYIGIEEGNVISLEAPKGPSNPALGKDALSPAEKLAPHAGVGKGPIGKAIGSAVTTAKNVGRFIQGKPEIPTLEDRELNELARLAGLSEAKKCNSTMEGKSCPVHGLKECGSMNEAKPDFLDLDKDGNKKESMKKAAKEKVDECGPGTMSPMSNMGQDEGSLSINTSMNSDGTKSVSVNATGNQADALAQMLKMAGIGGSYSAKTSDETVEEERDIEYANTPEEEMETVDAIMHQGQDLHREKEQYADRPKAGDNPMATPTRESIEMPKKISKMLEGIKKIEKE